MPAGISRLGLRGRSEWVATIFAAVEIDVPSLRAIQLLVESAVFRSSSAVKSRAFRHRDAVDGMRAVASPPSGGRRG